MTDPEAHIFPPPFDGKRPGGQVVRIRDVDALLDLAAEHAGVAKDRLDRRRLESALHMIGAPHLHVERATMVLAGRARQARRIAMQRSVARTKAIAGLVVVAIALTLYGFRLRARLRGKLTRAEQAGSALAEARGARDALRARTDDTALIDQADDRVSVARRHYDEAANDYDASVRGFPTTPFVRLVGLPERIPMSWERDAPGEPER